MMFSASSQLIVVAGVPIGKVLGTSLDFRVPFLFFAVTMGAAAVLICRVVPQPDVELDDRPLTLRHVVRKYRRVLGSHEVMAAVGAYFLMFCGFGLFASFLPTCWRGRWGCRATKLPCSLALGGWRT
jgi:predicted MFS family arabinose efflux permease